QAIKRRGKIIGFKCECGYKHIQKRPIVASTPAIPTPPQLSIIRKETKINKTPNLTLKQLNSKGAAGRT
ncbi:MAG: hypothetical protein ACPLYF_00800, partial [Fervidobacterium sp.]